MFALLYCTQVFDHDRSGYIDRSELQLTMERLGEQLSDEDLDAMMRSADTDGDGKIDLDGAFVPNVYECALRTCTSSNASANMCLPAS